MLVDIGTAQIFFDVVGSGLAIDDAARRDLTPAEKLQLAKVRHG